MNSQPSPSTPNAHNGTASLHEFYNKNSSTASGSHCGRSLVKGKGLSLKGFLNKSGSVTLSKGQTQKHGGLCPTGHTQLAAQNRTELLHIAEQHHEAGGGLLFGTLTMQAGFTSTPDFYSRDGEFRSSPQFYEVKNNTKGNASSRKAELTLLREEFDAVCEREDSWQSWQTAVRIEAVKDGVSKAFAGKAWGHDLEALDVIGRATALEFVCTPSSADGWGSVKTHVHVHFLLFTHSPSHLPETVAKVKARISARWTRTIARFGFTASVKRQELKQVTQSCEDFMNVAAYLTKGSAGEDGIFSALAYAQANGADRSALSFFRNLENAMKGTHLFRATPSLKNAYGVPDLRVAQRKGRLERSTEVFAALIPSTAAEDFLSDSSLHLLTLERALSEGDITQAEQIVASRFGQVRASGLGETVVRKQKPDNLLKVVNARQTKAIHELQEHSCQNRSIDAPRRINPHGLHLTCPTTR